MYKQSFALKCRTSSLITNKKLNKFWPTVYQDKCLICNSNEIEDMHHAFICNTTESDYIQFATQINQYIMSKKWTGNTKNSTQPTLPVQHFDWLIVPIRANQTMRFSLQERNQNPILSIIQTVYL